MKATNVLITLVIGLVMTTIDGFPCGERNQCECTYQVVDCRSVKRIPKIPLKVRLGKDMKIRVDNTDFEVDSLDETYGYENVLVQTDDIGLCSTIALQFWWVNCQLHASDVTEEMPAEVNDRATDRGRSTSKVTDAPVIDKPSDDDRDEPFYDDVYDKPRMRSKIRKTTVDIRTRPVDVKITRHTQDYDGMATPTDLEKKTWQMTDYVMYGCIAAGLGVLLLILVISSILVIRKDDGKRDPKCVVAVAEFFCCLFLSPCLLGKLIWSGCKKVCCCGKKKSSQIQLKEFDNILASSRKSLNSTGSEYEVFNRAEYEIKRKEAKRSD